MVRTEIHACQGEKPENRVRLRSAASAARSGADGSVIGKQQRFLSTCPGCEGGRQRGSRDTRGIGQTTPVAVCESPAGVERGQDERTLRPGSAVRGLFHRPWPFLVATETALRGSPGDGGWFWTARSGGNMLDAFRAGRLASDGAFRRSAWARGCLSASCSN